MDMAFDETTPEMVRKERPGSRKNTKMREEERVYE